MVVEAIGLTRWRRRRPVSFSGSDLSNPIFQDQQHREAFAVTGGNGLFLLA
jgi:hypothetical protein